jgi:thioredoxin
MRIVTNEELERLKSEGKVVFADFYAEWCQPCKALSGVIDGFYRKYKNITFVKVNLETTVEPKQLYNIRSIPTVIIFKGNEIIDRSTGVNSSKYYEDILDKFE